MPHKDALERQGYVLEIRERNRRYVQEVRSRTFCADCGGQPIEWHNDTHLDRHASRVGAMMGRTVSVATIQAEIDRCVPLCRRCHMRRDGRMKNLNYGKG